MDWGRRRRNTILFAIGSLIVLILAIPLYFKYANKAPTCFDDIQNQGEEGIDCGGPCALLCADDTHPPLTVFSRLFKIGYGTYSALALVENPNQKTYSYELDYEFRVYDSNNVLLFTVPGKTFVPPGRVFPVYEHSILTGNREASKITFNITNTDTMQWLKGTYNEPNIDVKNISNQTVDTRSRITADIYNNEVYPLKNVPVVVVVYDKDNNAREASETVIDYLSPGDSTPVTFTWNDKFDFDVSKIDITPLVAPRDLGK